MTESISRKILFVVIEGLDSTTYQSALTDNIDILKKAGASTVDAQVSSNPSLAANLTSLLSGTGPLTPTERAASESRMQPDILGLAGRSGRSVAAFFNSPALNGLLGEEVSDEIYFINAPVERYDFKLMQVVAKSIRVDRPDLCLVYMGGSRPLAGNYQQKVETCDKALGIVLYMMSLFGLFRQYHIHLLGLPSRENISSSGADISEISVPWIISGLLIKVGYTILKKVSIVDTVPTLAKLLNLPQSPLWKGCSVDEAFVDFTEDLQSVA